MKLEDIEFIDEEIEALLRCYMKSRFLDWTEKERNNFHRYSKVIVESAIEVMKADQEATKEIREGLKKSLAKSKK